MIDPVQQIKERLSIVDVISTYITLLPVGKNHKANCPFHNEKTPSFHVSAERGSYYCFGCGAKGDIFSFVQEFEGLDFKGALSVLALRAGVELQPSGVGAKESTDHLFEIMEQATVFFESQLKTKEEAREYLKHRGVLEKTIKDFRLGYAKDDWKSLQNHLLSLGYQKKDMIRVGLIKESTGNTYDTFRDRIMFPICDSSGRVIAFSGRALTPDDKNAKYLNSPDTPLFQKSDVLYGLHLAKDAIRKMGCSILVEGQLDLILSHQAGFANTIASSGTALTDRTNKGNSLNHFGIIKRLSNTILLAFDGDNAGLKAMYRATSICLSLGMDVKTVPLKEGMDPADILLKEGKESWVEILKHSEQSILFLSRYIIEKDHDEHSRARSIREKILPLILLLGSSMEQKVFIRDIATLSGIPAQAIEKDLTYLSSGWKPPLQQEEYRKHGTIVSVDKDKIAKIKKMAIGIYSLLLRTSPHDIDQTYIRDVKEAHDQLSDKDIEGIVFEIEEIYQDDEKKMVQDFALYAKELHSLLSRNHLQTLEQKIKEGAGDETLKQYQDILKGITNNTL